MSYKKSKGHRQQVNAEVKKEDKKPKVVALLSGGLDSRHIPSINDVELLKVGRHFRLSKEAKLIVHHEMRMKMT